MKHVRLMVSVAVAVTLMAPVGALARAAATACPQAHDQRGDVEDPYSAASTGGWDFDSLDVLGAAVSADDAFVTTSVRVARLAEGQDPSHSYLWSVRLATRTS